MNLQPLYDVKTQLEQAAVAGTGLLHENFRLARAAGAMRPLAASSPALAKIEQGLRALPEMPAAARGGALLDLLALVDAVVYTQAKTGMPGTLAPLPAGTGAYCELACSQIQPVLKALTSTGSGRVETVRSAWEAHPEWFADYRLLPALAAGLKDASGEMAAQCAEMLKAIGAPAVPLLKQGFDPAGKKEMARRVDVIAAVEQENAVPWLREVLPAAKKDVRAAVIRALGASEKNVPLLLGLAGTERGAGREAVLNALGGLDGGEVRAFWAEELEKNSGAVKCLWQSSCEWAADLVAAGMQKRLEAVLRRGKSGGRIDKAAHADLMAWAAAMEYKDAPSLLRFWRWADGHMPEIEALKNHVGQPLLFHRQLETCLMNALCCTASAPLCELCRELWAAHRQYTRWLPHALIASLLTRPAAEVYGEFSPCICTAAPPPGAGTLQRLFQDALLEGLNQVWRRTDGTYYVYGGKTTAEPLDRRWLERMTQAVWKTNGRQRGAHPVVYWEAVEEYDVLLTRLANPEDPADCALMQAYLRGRMAQSSAAYTYTRWLLQFGGSPRGILGTALARDPKANRFYMVYYLMEAIAEAVPKEELIALLEEVLASPGLRPDTKPQLMAVIPYTIDQLRAGKPFPPRRDWEQLAAGV